MRSYKKIDDRTLEVTVKKDGKVTSRIRNVVSADGKSRARARRGIDAEGKKFENTTVDDKDIQKREKPSFPVADADQSNAISQAPAAPLPAAARLAPDGTYSLINSV